MHSVVSTKTINTLSIEVKQILDAIVNKAGKVDSWKFYQYMSYDMPKVDKVHRVSKDAYLEFCENTQKILGEMDVKLHFKDNEEMNNSLFNILSYGNAQYMLEGDSWSTSRRTQDLRTYQNMQSLFDGTSIDVARFSKFHEVIF